MFSPGSERWGIHLVLLGIGHGQSGPGNAIGFGDRRRHKNSRQGLCTSNLVRLCSSETAFWEIKPVRSRTPPPRGLPLLWQAM